ncbi:MAG: universal stress protein [Candidatus Rokubacteria bacterium]|nr:universal stress protein [Candidatus Rokubacteria bacterium]
MPVRQVLLATDFSEPSEMATRVAREYARRLDARLHVLHVVSPVTDPASRPLLEKLAAEVGREVPVVVEVVSGGPAREIIRYAQSHAIDLIVLGTHGRTGWSRALLGSVAERVVRWAPCPVLTVPREPAATQAVGAPEAEAALRRCLVCATVSDDLICEPCRARIRGEAVERKQREERPGRC